MTCGIYLITCKVTCRGYVGQSIRIEDRWKEHHKRFSPAQFDYTILEVCDQSALGLREIFHIKDQNTRVPCGFNVRAGGRSWSMNWTPEMRARLSATKRAKVWTPEERARLRAAHAGKSNPHKGVQWTKHTRAKQSASQAGRTHSEAAKEKMRKPKPPGFGVRMSAAKTGTSHTEESRAKMKMAWEARRARGPESERPPLTEEHKQKLRQAWALRKARASK